MNILIIEDEPLVAKDIELLIRKLEPDVRVLALLSSVENARAWFNNNPQPDLVLADIQLSDGISFEIFESGNIRCPIIFTTAYDDYAIRAFKVNSIDYLLKPIDPSELMQALKKYKLLVEMTGVDRQVKELVRQLAEKNIGFKERFLVMHGNSLVPIVENQIAYFQKDQLIFLHTMEASKYICELSALDDLESLLNPDVFFRVNRQYILHIQAVGKVRTTHKGLTVVLKPPFNLELDISREKATAFKAWLG
jgi:DNA-binding LytR/AlgR family response regulator